MKLALIILLSLHHAVSPLAYGILAIILIVAMEAGAITAWVWFPYGCSVSITALIFRWDDRIYNTAFHE